MDNNNLQTVWPSISEATGNNVLGFNGYYLVPAIVIAYDRAI